MPAACLHGQHEQGPAHQSVSGQHPQQRGGSRIGAVMSLYLPSLVPKTTEDLTRVSNEEAAIKQLEDDLEAKVGPPLRLLVCLFVCTSSLPAATRVGV